MQCSIDLSLLGYLFSVFQLTFRWQWSVWFQIYLVSEYFVFIFQTVFTFGFSTHWQLGQIPLLPLKNMQKMNLKLSSDKLYLIWQKNSFFFLLCSSSLSLLFPAFPKPDVYIKTQNISLQISRKKRAVMQNRLGTSRFLLPFFSLCFLTMQKVKYSLE